MVCFNINVTYLICLGNNTTEDERRSDHIHLSNKKGMKQSKSPEERRSAYEFRKKIDKIEYIKKKDPKNIKNVLQNLDAKSVGLSHHGEKTRIPSRYIISN